MWDIDKTNIREDLEDRIEEIQQQMETPAKVVEVIPNADEGSQGSKKIVKTGTQVFLYHKVDNEWYKIEMEKA